MWIELTEAVGGRAWRDHGLRKGASHKYIRRVPKPGGGYRYYYRATGATRAVGADLVPGAKFNLSHDGQAGHFEVVRRAGNQVVLRHDESGGTMTVDAGDLGDLLKREHADIVGAAQARAKRDLEAARKHGSPKQIARQEARAKRLGVGVGADLAAQAQDIATRIAEGEAVRGVALVVRGKKGTISGTVDGVKIRGFVQGPTVFVDIGEGADKVRGVAKTKSGRPPRPFRPSRPPLSKRASTEAAMLKPAQVAGIMRDRPSIPGPYTDPTQSDLDEFRRGLADPQSDASRAVAEIDGPSASIIDAFKDYWTTRRTDLVRSTFPKVTQFAKDRAMRAKHVDPADLDAWRSRPGHTVIEQAPNVIAGDFDAPGASAVGAAGVGATLRTYRTGAEIPAGRVAGKRIVQAPDGARRVEYLVKTRGKAAQAKYDRGAALQDAASPTAGVPAVASALERFAAAAGGDWQVERGAASPDLGHVFLRSPKAGREFVFEVRGFGPNAVREKEIGTPGVAGEDVHGPTAVESAVSAAKGRR